MRIRQYTIFLCSIICIIACKKEVRLALPEPVSNNAVAVLKKDGREVAYSFYGIDSTLGAGGVHNKVFRTDLETGASALVGQLPDLGRLASSASVISNKAYVAGGYAVLPNGKEKSSDNLFIFDPETEQFTRGATLPIPIDDHVQDTWRGKLLFVISGWTDSLNTNAVQVYDPAANTWQLATPLPDEPGAKVFGGCGLIAGDTIYFLGGATFAKFFPPSRNFYKGAIDPSDPLRITWLPAGEYPGEFRYRSAAFLKENKVFFVGGSNETYNYNGLSYSEKKPLEPNTTSLVYDLGTGLMKTAPSPLQRMDLRGVIRDSKGNNFTVGGMAPNQKVTGELMKLAN